MKYLTTTDAAERIGMSEDYVARQCRAGVIRAKKLGITWRITEAALAEFMGDAQPAPAARKRLSARQQRHAS